MRRRVQISNGHKTILLNMDRNEKHLVFIFEVDSHFTFTLAEFMIIIMLFICVQNALINDHMGIMTKILGHPRLRLMYLFMYTPYAMIYDLGIILDLYGFIYPNSRVKKVKVVKEPQKKLRILYKLFNMTY